MHNKKFNAKTSYEILLCYLNKIQMDPLSLEGNIKYNVSDLLNIFFDEHDNHGSWKTYYQIAFGEPFTDQLYVSAEELFTLLLQFAIDRTINRTSYQNDLLNFLFLIRYTPEYNLEEKEYKAGSIIWDDIVEEHSKDLSSHPESLFPKGSFSISKLLQIIPSFVDEFIYQYQYVLPSAVLEDLFAFRSVLLHNPDYQSVCEEALQKMVGSSQTIHTLNEKTLFTLFIEICALHVYKWNLNIKGLLTTLFYLRYSSNESWTQFWIEIWQEMLQEIQ